MNASVYRNNEGKVVRKLTFAWFKQRVQSKFQSAGWIPYLCLDVCFRIIFGSRGMEDVLLSLVNSILRNAGLSTVVKLEIRNPYVLRRWRNDKEPIVDVRATDEEGNVFDLEMQVDEHADFAKRVDYYEAKLLVDQIGKGDEYGDLRRVVSIFFVLFPIRKGNETLWFDVQRRLSVYDRFDANGLITTIFVRLPISSEQIPQGFNDPELQDWVKMFGYPWLTADAQIRELGKKSPIFKKVWDKMGYFFATGWGRRARDERERARRDWNAILKYANDEGEGKGRVKGRVEGRAEVITCILSSRFPNEISKLPDDWRSNLGSKSPKEVEDLVGVCMNCSAIQDFTSRLYENDERRTCPKT